MTPEMGLNVPRFGLPVTRMHAKLVTNEALPRIKEVRNENQIQPLPSEEAGKRGDSPTNQFNQPRQKEDSVSIKVTIEHPSGAFMRSMEIARRATEPVMAANGLRDTDEIGTYDVILSNGSRQVQTSSFEHRYGDDLLTLVSEAIDALGGRGGILTTGLKR